MHIQENVEAVFSIYYVKKKYGSGIPRVLAITVVEQQPRHIEERGYWLGVFGQ